AEEEIRRKNMQLAQASRMKSEFLANMSHELRTPLNAIIGFSEVLKDGVMGKMDADQQEYVTDIFNSGQHLLELINDILDLSKIESGKMELDLEKTHIPDLLNNSLSIIKEKAMAHQIQLDLNIGEQVKDCFLDARRFKQIMYNLLSNAVKFTPDGGNVRIDARRIASTDSGDDYLKISVTDTGIGISEEDQKKLFQPFHQIDSKLSRKYEGTGLGLVMIRHLCELHGGTVDVESAEGKGSTFTVSLPYRTRIKAVAGKKQPEGTSSKRPAKATTSESPLVLIVEDDDQAAELMRVQLEGERYRSFRVATAEEALEWLQENSPDLITLDILLPGMDGWDFLARIRENKSTLHIPVVVVSIVADEKKGFSLGASEVLQKPVRKRVLLAAVAGIAPREKGQPMTVLVVDDDPKTVDVMARHLESAHFSVLRAYGGQEGIDLATSELPGLILLDLMMPEVSGFNVVDALKASKETAHIPIIILTAKTITEEDRQRLNGDIMKIVEKSSFNHGSFIVEVDRAMRKAGKTAPEQKEEEE
ncbi:MAG: response regulator, partial [Mariprofundaceae bacterium]